MENTRQIAAPRTSDILWRIVIGLVALFLMAAGGAWLMHASIDPTVEAQAAAESPAAPAPKQ